MYLYLRLGGKGRDYHNSFRTAFIYHLRIILKNMEALKYIEGDKTTDVPRTSQSQLNYVVIDPSSFTSIRKIDALLHILDQIKFHLTKDGELKVVLPTSLFYSLKLRDPRKMTDIFISWLPFRSKYWVENHTIKLVENNEYRRLLDVFFIEYNPIPAREFVGGMDKIGEKSIFRRELEEKFRFIVGNIIFELVAVSSKLDALIICLGERTISFFERIGQPILRAQSRFKERIRRHERIHSGIRMIGYALTAQAVGKFIRFLEMDNPEIRVLGVGAGLIIIGDG